MKKEGTKKEIIPKIRLAVGIVVFNTKPSNKMQITLGITAIIGTKLANLTSGCCKALSINEFPINDNTPFIKKYTMSSPLDSS